MHKKSILEVDIKGKRVLVRTDFNVPFDSEKNISDDNRMRSALPTLEYLLNNGAGLIIMSHLGRPEGKVREEMRLTTVAARLVELLKRPVRKCDDCIGARVEEVTGSMGPGDVVLLENVRFHKEETANAPGFARQLASLGDIFVNDAFSTCHRTHASTEGITHYLESVAGLLLRKEIECFETINSAPERPFALVLGGVKVQDKIPVIENLLARVDLILIGGAMAYTFLKQQGIAIGSSHYEEGVAGHVRSILRNVAANGVEVVLPVDHVVCTSLDQPGRTTITEGPHIEEGLLGVDIGPKTAERFNKKLQGVKTVVWNGPMGVFERDEWGEGTRKVAEAIAALPFLSVICGGDSAAAVRKFNCEGKMSHISTGGGASIEYLEGKSLPGIIALDDRA